jgi:hypothetical protein
MKTTSAHVRILVLGVLGIQCLTGCDMSFQEAAEAGLFDFVAGTITDTLARLLPIADLLS